VTISKSFLLGKHEVTQAQWTRLKGRHQNRWTGDNLPVERINRRDALSFCEQLTELAHFEKGLPQRFFFTLPTEAQWEYACRAGTDTMFYYGTDEDYSQLSEYAWYARNSNSRTHPVGYKLPNKWGLYDMYGNVWEWCRDWYSDSYAGGSIIDPLGPKNGTDRVVRGGSWSNIETLFRSALRSWDSPDISSDEIGFRVVMISEPD
jgi:formylglycine-generating enzyme required for sulfatase activity